MALSENVPTVFCRIGGYFTVFNARHNTILHGIEGLNVFAYDTKIRCMTGYSVDLKIFIIQEYPYPDGTRLCALASCGILNPYGFVLSVGYILPDAENMYGVHPTLLGTRGQVSTHPEYDFQGNIVFNIWTMSSIMTKHWCWNIWSGIL